MGLTHMSALGHMTCFMGFDWLRERHMAQLTLTSQLTDFTL